MSDTIDMAGRVIGRYRVTIPAISGGAVRAEWWCVCGCGRRYRMTGNNLRKMERGRWQHHCPTCDGPTKPWEREQ
jgi:hypothetical protein